MDPVTQGLRAGTQGSKDSETENQKPEVPKTQETQESKDPDTQRPWGGFQQPESAQRGVVGYTTAPFARSTLGFSTSKQRTDSRGPT